MPTVAVPDSAVTDSVVPDLVVPDSDIPQSTGPGLTVSDSTIPELGSVDSGNQPCTQYYPLVPPQTMITTSSSPFSVHSNGTHVAAPTNSQRTIAAKIERVKRPTISATGSSEEWTYFLTRWQEYVDATQITGKDKVLQLLECCDDNLCKDITRNAGGSLANKTVEQVLTAVKKLAVREENAMVARVRLSDMKQDRDKAIRSFECRS